jgi:hypothetical protein
MDERLKGLSAHHFSFFLVMLVIWWAAPWNLPIDLKQLLSFSGIYVEGLLTRIFTTRCNADSTLV